MSAEHEEHEVFDDLPEFDDEVFAFFKGSVLEGLLSQYSGSGDDVDELLANEYLASLGNKEPAIGPATPGDADVPMSQAQPSNEFGVGNAGTLSFLDAANLLRSFDADWPDEGEGEGQEE